jgi:hypothetical protein
VISIDTIKDLLSAQIDLFRDALEKKSKIHKYDFQHPEVIRASEALDVLIERYLKLTTYR